MRKKIPSGVTPIKCISYALSQPGVCSAVTGVKNSDELLGSLAYKNASEVDREYGRDLEEML